MEISSILVLFVFPDNLEVDQVPNDVNWTNGIGKNDDRELISKSVKYIIAWLNNKESYY